MSEQPKHTPKPWRKGSGSFIICDRSLPHIPGNEAMDYYGGRLVCESIAPQDMDIIAAAPELLEALKRLCDLPCNCPCEIGVDEMTAYGQARAAIDKAEGRGE